MLIPLGWTPLGRLFCSSGLYSTKIVMLGKNGLWGTLHQARNDVSILLGLVFLLLLGGGSLVLDVRVGRKEAARP